MRKPSPEEWKRIRRVLEEGREARRQVKEMLDRVAARRVERQRRYL